MTAPRWARSLLHRLAPTGRAEEVVGDLEEAHRRRVRCRGRVIASVLTGLEALDMARALILARSRSNGPRFSLLDFKLGVRMLVRYPGLTIVGGLAMAFGISVGAVTFEVATQIVRPTLPLDDGDRLVGVLNVNAAGRLEAPSLHDFATWREELESVEELGAFRTLERNLILDATRSEPVQVVEINASGFRTTRVPPLLGRALDETDERASAASIVVIGYDVWQTRFGGDPDVVGRTIRLGSTQSTVIGVMPVGFAFPVSHGFWTPLRVSARDYDVGQAPRIQVFGRLSAGVTLDEVQAELAVLGTRAAADLPDRDMHLPPQVMPYARSVAPLPDIGVAGLTAINVFIVMLLVLICGNVALLTFARAATRESEIAVRNALGASRGRIISQLFTEALVLGSVAAILGLSVAGLGLEWTLGALAADIAPDQLPFWFSDRLAPATVVYGGALAVLGAVVAGVVPALKMTGRGVEVRLRQASAGGGGPRFARLWTAVIVSQVAVTVVFPATAFLIGRYIAVARSVDVGFRAEEYLAARLEMDRQPTLRTSDEASHAELATRLGATYQELERRLSVDPRVAGVTFAERMPGTYHPQRLVEIDDPGAAHADASSLRRLSPASVDVDFFGVLEAPILSGRGFDPGDLVADPSVVIVNRSFVDGVLEGRNAVGRRLRYWVPEGQEPAPWYEIVGVVGDMGTIAGDMDPRDDAGFYHPAAPGAVHPVHVLVHVRGDVESFAVRLNEIATNVDPTLRLYDPLPVNVVVETAGQQVMGFMFWLQVLVSSVTLLLSLAAIYSVMSFTVSRRVREIGVRVALGAEPLRIVAAIFRQPLTRVALGVIAGGILTTWLSLAWMGGLSVKEATLVAAYSALIMAVCMLACIVPTRRALRIEPIEALRADG